MGVHALYRTIMSKRYKQIERQTPERKTFGDPHMVSHLGRFLSTAQLLTLSNTSKEIRSNVDGMDMKRRLLESVIGPKHVDEFMDKCTVKYTNVAEKRKVFVGVPDAITPIPRIYITCISNDVRIDMYNLSFTYGCVYYDEKYSSVVVAGKEKLSGIRYYVHPETGWFCASMDTNMRHARSHTLSFDTIEDAMSTLGTFPQTLCVQSRESHPDVFYNPNTERDAIDWLRIRTLYSPMLNDVRVREYLVDYIDARLDDFRAEVMGYSNAEDIVKEWDKLIRGAIRENPALLPYINRKEPYDGPIVAANWKEMSGYVPGRESAVVTFLYKGTY